MSKKRVGVIVLGDVGHSPRMQYHCYSLNKEGYDVDIIGYCESRISSDLLQSVTAVDVPQPPNFKNYVPRLFSLILKTIWQAVTLFWVLIWNGSYQILLVQNPPAIPTLFICWLYCFLLRKKFIIDWHNYAYTVLALSVGRNNKIVKYSRLLELYFGQQAHDNICVSNAMKEDLAKKWNIRATTLYDRPGPQFTGYISADKRIDLLNKLSSYDDKFTKLIHSDRRLALLISSTSWTEDEDFSLLLDALRAYDLTDENYPSIICAITGKGPMKDYYVKVISDMEWKKVHIVTLWLEPEDYPSLLACADLGVCLHTSSSGFDLPMKVLDMFGSGLPVCAYKYPCLSELIQDNVNGLTFENFEELYEHLKWWFQDFPNQQERQVNIRNEIKKFQNVSWHTNWRENVLHIFQ